MIEAPDEEPLDISGWDLRKALRYLYVLRTLLAVRWIEAERGPVPVEFEVLVDALVEPGARRAAIQELVERKRSATERHLITKLPVLDMLSRSRVPDPGPRELDLLFQSALAEVWPD